jgi:hypothetical protein
MKPVRTNEIFRYRKDAKKSQEGSPMKKIVFTVLFMIMSLIYLSHADAKTFKFYHDNQGWTASGFYDDQYLNPINGNFGTDGAPYFTNANASEDHIGVLTLGTGGSSVPQSPTNSKWVHYDLNSPDLSHDGDWQGITSFSYDITGEQMMIATVKRDVFVQAVVLAQAPGQSSETYYTDGQFHKVRTTLDGGSWETHTFNLSSAKVPSGAIIKKVNLRIFFNPGTAVDGFIYVDNVAPSGSQCTSVDLRVNGYDTWTSFPKGGQANITVSVNAGSLQGETVDYWLMLQYFDFTTYTWKVYGIIPLPQGPLATVPETFLGDIGPWLPPGYYYLTAGVDTTLNYAPDRGGYSDSVGIYIY